MEAGNFVLDLNLKDEPKHLRNDGAMKVLSNELTQQFQVLEYDITSYVLYKVNSNKDKMLFITFCTNVAEQLLEKCKHVRIRNTGGRPSSSLPIDINPLCLVGKSFYFIIIVYT